MSEALQPISDIPLPKGQVAESDASQGLTDESTLTNI
jgi:hypothetical protein